MPSWKKIISSGSDAALNSLTVTNGITGSLLGTSSFATSASYALTAQNLLGSVTSASFASTASFLNNTTNAFIQNGNSFGATALLGTNDNQSFGLETSGSTRLFISSSGNVGIGTTTPNAKLDISGSAIITGSLTVTGDITGSNAIFSGTITAQKLVVQTITSSVLYSSGSNIFGNDLSNTQSFTGSLRVTGSGNHYIVGGNVGIGTTSPVYLLDVAGVINSVSGSSTTDVAYRINGSGILGKTTAGNFPSNTGYTRFIGPGMLFSANNDNTVQMVIMPTTGRVGIGTTSPNATLDVSGSVNISGSGTQIPFQITSGSTSLLFVSGSGRVGIGTITPNARLHISGAATTPLLRVSNPASADFTIQSDSTLTDYTGLYWGTDYKFLSKQSATLFVNTANNISFADGLAAKTTMNSNGQLGIGVNSAASILSTVHVRGIGSTSATTALRVENLNTSASLVVLNDGNVGIRTTAPSASLHVAGTTILSSSFNTAISGSTLKVQGSGSTLPIFTVVGSQGELFSINDSLSGSLFSVNDISGLPILEVFSDNTILLGNYQAPTLYTTNRILSTVLGSNVVYSFSTSSYDGVFIDYTVKSGSNARAGNFAAIWSGSSVNYMDNSTTDFGSTAGMILSGSISGSNLVVFASGSSAGWTFKGIIKSI